MRPRPTLLMTAADQAATTLAGLDEPPCQIARALCGQAGLNEAKALSVNWLRYDQAIPWARGPHHALGLEALPPLED